MVRFLGRHIGALVVPGVGAGARDRGASHFQSGFASKRRSTDFGKMGSPNSLLESDLECSALWYTRGFAMDTRMDWQTGELMVSVPTTNGCATPSIMAHGQKARFLLILIVLELPEEVQVRAPPSTTREGVIHGRGRAPSAGSSEITERMRCSLGACTMGAMSAITSEILRGLSVGVGTWSNCSRQRRVSSVNWRYRDGRGHA